MEKWFKRLCVKAALWKNNVESRDTAKFSLQYFDRPDLPSFDKDMEDWLR